MSKISKVVFIFAHLIDNPEVYKGKTNTDLEEEILKKIGSIPYIKQIEKVTVLDYPE